MAYILFLLTPRSGVLKSQTAAEAAAEAEPEAEGADNVGGSVAGFDSGPQQNTWFYMLSKFIRQLEKQVGIEVHVVRGSTRYPHATRKPL